MAMHSCLKRNGILQSLFMLVTMALVLLTLTHQHGFQGSYMESMTVESLSIAIQNVVPATIVVKQTLLSPKKNTGGDLGAYGNAFKMTGRSEKWSVWDANHQKALSHDDVSCIWTDFKPFDSPENKTFSHMCRYPVAMDKFVSGKLKKIGHFEDCNNLPSLWREATTRQHALASSTNKTMIYLDVGGNIGSCVMEMLHSTDAKIVVFEPHPHNLAQLTTTIQGLAEHLSNRVVVFPIGVGDVMGNFTMHMASNNRGNSVIGQEIRDAPSQQFLSSTSIFVERLNDIFNADQIVIPLMKMDIQGFECKAWDGMSSLLPAVDIIKTEAEHKFLIGQGCSPKELQDRISKADFTFKGGLNIIARRNLLVDMRE